MLIPLIRPVLAYKDFLLSFQYFFVNSFALKISYLKNLDNFFYLRNFDKKSEILLKIDFEFDCILLLKDFINFELDIFCKR